jgi:hypothetical protein
LSHQDRQFKLPHHRGDVVMIVVLQQQSLPDSAAVMRALATTYQILEIKSGIPTCIDFILKMLRTLMVTCAGYCQ